LRQEDHGVFDFLHSKKREAIHEGKVGEIACIHQPEKRITQESIIVNVISSPDAVVCERAMVAHHLYTCMAPAAMVRPSASNTLALYTNPITFHVKSVSNELILMLWISRAGEDGHIVVKNSVGHHVVGDEDVNPP